VVAIGSRQQAGVIGVAGRARAPVERGGVARRRIGRCWRGRVGREKNEWLVRH